MLCPYCQAPVNIESTDKIYSANYKSLRSWLYVCSRYPTCDAYVGVHPGTLIPLGSLANKELRMYRQRTHAIFDLLWKDGRSPHKRSVLRNKAYAWLRRELNITKDECHIGMFNIARCKRTIELCQLRLQRKQLERIDYDTD